MLSMHRGLLASLHSVVCSASDASLPRAFSYDALITCCKRSSNSPDLCIATTAQEETRKEQREKVTRPITATFETISEVHMDRTSESQFTSPQQHPRNSSMPRIPSGRYAQAYFFSLKDLCHALE